MHGVRTGTSITSVSHLRRAQAYKAMDELLQQQDLSFDRKLFGLIQLYKMEQFVGSPALEDLHLQALNDCIESNGGISDLLHRRPDDVVLDPIFYAGQFVHARLPILKYEVFEAMRTSFIESLKRVELWVESLQLPNCVAAGAAKTDEQVGMVNAPKVCNIVRYTNHIITKWWEQDTECSFQESAVFFFGFVLCTIMVEAKFGAVEAIAFLARAQHCMETSALSFGSACSEGIKLKPKVAAKILSHVRRKFADAESRLANEEIRVCQAAIAAQRAFTLLQAPTRLRLTRKLAKFAFVVTGAADEELRDDGFLDQLQGEMFESWTKGTELSHL